MEKAERHVMSSEKYLHTTPIQCQRISPSPATVLVGTVVRNYGKRFQIIMGNIVCCSGDALWPKDRFSISPITAPLTPWWHAGPAQAMGLIPAFQNNPLILDLNGRMR